MKIKYHLTAPVSHIGEVSSTGSIFQTILTAYGRVPVITGNSIRGTLRDYGASHMLNAIGIAVDKITFNVLYSGGNLSGASKLDVARAKQVREHFPLVSLLGGGLGSMIIGGKMDCGFAYPICSETESITGISSMISYKSMIDEIEFTRTDDSKNDKLSRYITDVETDVKSNGSASTQMRYSVQYLAAGTELIQEIKFYNNTTDLEMGAFYTCVIEWFKHPKLGGMGNKGFGRFDAELIASDDTILIATSHGDVDINEIIRDKISDYYDVASKCQEFLPLLGGKIDGKA